MYNVAIYINIKKIQRADLLHDTHYTAATLLLVGFTPNLACVSRVMSKTYLPNFMVLDQILREKWAKNSFLTFDP